MTRRLTFLAIAAAAAAASLLAPSGAAAAECELTPRALCYGVESAAVSLSTTQAGAHPDVEFDVVIKQDPESPPNVIGLRDAYSPTRNIRFNLPPGLIGDPNVLGFPQQCTVAELMQMLCPNGSQVGVTKIGVYQKNANVIFREPIYMMQPPGGDVVARLGTIAGVFPTFINLRVRSESDYGLVAEVTEAPPTARLITLESTLWGVPADPSHDNERCTAAEFFFNGCVTSPSRPPGSRPLPFMTNPTRCGTPLQAGVNASSWFEPTLLPENEVTVPVSAITGCNRLPFGPRLTAEPTSHHTSSPTGLDLTIELPKADGVNVLEPSQTRDIRIDLPRGITINPGSADGLAVCSVEQVHFRERVASECPDAAKMAATEFEVAGLPRRIKGAIYLREPEPGNLFRIWIVADDLGAHVKLPGQLEVDEETGQIDSVVLENPQVPLREVKLLFKSGFRAPLATPSSCGEYFTHYDFTPWSGGPHAVGDAPMQIDEGCDSDGFAPKLTAGSVSSKGGDFSPFTFTLSRQDSEQNISSFDLSLPPGLTASFSGIARCEGVDAETGHCPAAARIGRTTVADGLGPAPLWIPQPDKDPTAVYLGGPYKGAPFSIIAVVPAQAGPFDLGLEVVRSAVFVDPTNARATAKTDPLPQIIEGIPILYKTINVVLDRPNFSLNPTSCAAKETTVALASTGGRVASSSAPYAATNCAKLAFKPKLSIRLFGGTHRNAHPKLRATLKMPAGGANIGGATVTLPHSEFLDQFHIDTVCTRVQFAAQECPAGSIYGHAVAKSPLFDFPLEGPVYLRSNGGERLLPDLVAALHGPATMPVEVDVVGFVDSVNESLRTKFLSVPDAPVSEFVLQMQGGKKGLIVNSEQLCGGVHRANAAFAGQNGKRVVLHPALQTSCKKKGSGKGKKGK